MRDRKDREAVPRPGLGPAEATETPGKRTLVETRAAAGVAGKGGRLPHLEAIQASFGRHAISDILAHTGDEAAEAAAELGAPAYAFGGEIAFAASPDLHVAAHEAAHVVQQRAGVVGTAAPGDAFEAHANAVADRVVRGESAEDLLDAMPRGGGGGGGPVVQRFEPPEHARMGVDAPVELAPGYKLTHREMVPMGDFFESIDQMRLFARAGTRGVGTREEIEYVRAVELGGTPRAAWIGGDAGRKLVADTVDARGLKMAGTNRRHFPSASGEAYTMGMADRAGAAPDPANDAVTGDLHVVPELDNAVVGYRYYHLRALAEAAMAGASGKPVDAALATEGFGAHFLTDSFAAGHVRTQRQSIKEFWNAKVPLFFTNLKGWLGERIGEKYQVATDLPLGNGLVSGAARPFVFPRAATLVNEKLDAAGELGFGDLVSGALHDYDNLEGLRATSGGRSVVLHGDGEAGKGGGDGDYVDEEILAQRAVVLGVEEVQQAWARGRGGSPRDIVAALRGSDGLYAAERLIPEAKPDKAQSPTHTTPPWGFGDIEQLFKDPQFVRGAAIFAVAKVNTILAAVGDDAKARAAVNDGVVPLLVGHTIATLREIVHWMPTHSSQLEYAKQIAAIPGGMASLEPKQRKGLLDQMISATTADTYAPLAVALLASAPDEEARATIRAYSWGRLWSALDHNGMHGPFAGRFPAEDYAENMMPGFPKKAK